MFGLVVLLCIIFKILFFMILSNLIVLEKVYFVVIDYLDWCIWGLMFFFLFFVLWFFLVGIIFIKFLNKVVFIVVLVNIFCNWFFIFYFDMGIVGVVIVLFFVELCLLIILFIYVL